MAETVTVGGLGTRKASSVREGVLQVSRVLRLSAPSGRWRAGEREISPTTEEGRWSMGLFTCQLQRLGWASFGGISGEGEKVGLGEGQDGAEKGSGCLLEARLRGKIGQGSGRRGEGP